MKSTHSIAGIKHGLHRLKFAATVAVYTGAALLTNNQTLAQTQTAEQWYQVELFVFANTDPQNSGAEQWPQELGLNYPDNIVMLRKDSTEQVDLDTLLADDSTLADTSSANQTGPTTSAQASISNATNPATQSTSTLSSIRPFVLLDSSQHQLSKAVDRIGAQRDFKLLFHGAWRQLIGKRNKSASLLIRGGDAYDDHFELEGSINLSVERYLHINTDLWLSTFVRNSGSNQPLWPVLPRPPVPLDSQTPDQSTGLFSSTTNQTALSFNGNTGNSTLGASLQQSLASSFNNMFDMDMRNKQYAVQQTVVMRQHRRMRSNELHYIDHPMFGLLIKIVPYDLPKNETADSQY